MAIRFVALVIVVVAAFLRAAPAHALYFCESTSLLPSDLARLEIAAGELLGPRGIERGTEWYCRGPRGASARFETRHVGAAGRSTRWADVHCIRRDGPWSCDATERRALKVEVTVAGERLRITSRVPVDMDAATARAVVTKAFELAQSSTPTPSCQRPDGETTVLREQLIRQFSADDRSELEVFNSDLLLTTAGVVLVLREMRAGEALSYELRCWDEQIIVTG
jgi:hypothetical protein